MPEPPDDEMTSGHPSARLRAAPDIDEQPLPPLSSVFPDEARLPFDVVAYGPDVPDESELRLLGPLSGRRVLQLGAGSGHNAVAMASAGAHVIAVDTSHLRLEHVRNAADHAEVKVELHQSDLAELAFVRADTIDLAVSTFALASVPDLDRVFRQVNRVLRTECHLVFSLPHPAFVLTQGGSYFDRSARPWEGEAGAGEEQHRTISDVFTSLTRANFRVDTVLEPEPEARPRSPFWDEAMARCPATVIFRGRKEGL